MGSTFSELFYFYFQRVKKSKRKQGGGGIVVVVVELFKKKIYVNSFLCTVFLPSSLLNARFHFHLIHPHLIIQCKVSFSSHFIFLGFFLVVNRCKYK